MNVFLPSDFTDLPTIVTPLQANIVRSTQTEHYVCQTKATVNSSKTAKYPLYHSSNQFILTIEWLT